MPVVVNTNGEPSMRGRPARIDRTHGTIGTGCTMPFLVRSRGIVHIVRSASSSVHIMPATSSRRWPVKVRILTKAPNTGAEPIGGLQDQRQFGIVEHAIARDFLVGGLDAIERRDLDQYRARSPN